MKLARLILIFSGVIFLLAVIVAGLARTPAVQRWAVMRAAAKHPELHLQVVSVSAGLTSVAWRGVQVEIRGVKIFLDELHADYSLWAYWCGRSLQIENLTVKGLVVDASQRSSRKIQAGLAAVPAIAPGALAQVKLPWELILGAIDINGRVVLAGAPGQPVLPGEFQIEGGKIGPGRDGELRLKARVMNPAPGALVTTLHVMATLQLQETQERTFDRLNLMSVLDAAGPGLPGNPQMKLVAVMSRGATGENYRLSLDTLRMGQSENLLTFNAAPTAGGQSYAGDWSLSAHSTQLDAFLLGRTLPILSASGSGRFAFSPVTTSGALQGTLQIEASAFEKLRPELQAIGTVRLKSDFDLEADGGMIRLKKLEVALAGEQPVLALSTAGTPAYNLKQHRLEPTNPASGEILRLKLSALPVAWVAPFCAAVDISGGAINGEISLVQGEDRQFLWQTLTPLQTEGITVTRSGRPWLAKVALKMDAEGGFSPVRAQAFIRDLTLKTATGDSVQAKLKLSAPLDLHSPIAVEGDFSADLPTLPSVLLPTGPIKAKGSLGFTWQHDRIEVLRFIAESSDSQGNLLGSVTVTRAFTFDLAHGRAETGTNDEVQLANIKLGQLPLLPVPLMQEDVHLSGRIGPAEATLSASAGKLTLRTISPVPILDFSISKGKKPVLDRLKLMLQPVVEWNDGTLTRMQSGEVTVQTGADITLAGLSAEFTRQNSGLYIASTYNFDLPAWTSQPLLFGREALSSGQAKGELRAAFAGGAAQIETRTTFNGLIASESGQTLPVANLSFRADVDAAGHFSVQAPVLLDRAGQRSDLNFGAEGEIAPGGVSFVAKLTSERLELSDLLMLLAVAGSPLSGEGAASEAAQSRALSPPAADHSPFWVGTTGQLTVECKSVVSGQDWTMNGLVGKVVVDEDRLQLEKLEAAFDGESRFAAKGKLTFTSGLDPYRLTGDFSLSEFDVGRFFKALDPEVAPTLDGLFSIKGTLEGEGLNFDDTIDRALGTFDLTSRRGVFRGLKRNADKLSIVTKAVDFVGAIIGDKSAEKIGGVTYLIDQFAQELSELKYDQLSVRLVREPSLNLRLDDFVLLTQQIHLLGSGRILYVANQPLLRQPFQATLSLRARGKLEESLGKIHDLDGNRDQLGYAKTKTPVTLGGNLAKPDPESYFVQLGIEKVKEKVNELIVPVN